MPIRQLAPDFAELILRSQPLQASPSRPKSASRHLRPEKAVPELKCCAPLGVALPRLASRPTPA